MKRILLSLLIASSAQAFDLQTEINNCPRGYGQRQVSCEIHIPPGTYSGSWSVGGATTDQVQVAVSLIGAGPGWGSVGGAVGAAGTTLVYNGPPGGIMLDAVGTDWIEIKNISMVANGAGKGIRFWASNIAAATTQYARLDRLALVGDSTAGSVGISIEGAANAGQVDKFRIEQSRVSGFDTAISSNSDQAVDNFIGPGSEISGVTTAIDLVRGSLLLDGVAVQTTGSGSCDYRIGPAAGLFRVVRGYHEIGSAGGSQNLICLSAPWHPITVENSYINIQCDASQPGACPVDLVTGNHNSVIRFVGNDITAAGGAGDPLLRSVRVWLVQGTKAPTFVWSGNAVAPEVLTSFGRSVKIEALKTDSTRIWNDRNLDGVYQVGEPATP